MFTIVYLLIYCTLINIDTDILIKSKKALFNTYFVSMLTYGAEILVEGQGINLTFANLKI